MDETDFTLLLNEPSLRGIAVELIRLGEVSSGQWKVDQTFGTLHCYGKDLYISVEARPSYCDRGRVKVLVDWLPTSTRSPFIIWIGLSRYFYSLDTCIKENEQWLFAMDQFIADPEVGVCKHQPTTLNRLEEFHQLELEYIDGWTVNLTESVITGVSYRAKNCVCKIIPLATQPGFVWRWLFDVKVDEDAQEKILHVDGADAFPRHFMSLKNALSEAKRWLESRNQIQSI